VAGRANIPINTSPGAISRSLTFSSLTGDSLLAHIHQGAANTNGPVVFDKTGGAGGKSCTWTIPAGSRLTLAQVTALQKNGPYFLRCIRQHSRAERSGAKSSFPNPEVPARRLEAETGKALFLS
jgi:hypothetical protein